MELGSLLDEADGAIAFVERIPIPLEVLEHEQLWVYRPAAWVQYFVATDNANHQAYSVAMSIGLTAENCPWCRKPLVWKESKWAIEPGKPAWLSCSAFPKCKWSSAKKNGGLTPARSKDSPEGAKAKEGE